MTEVIVNVHRPELTPEERAKRMKLIKKAAEELIKSTYAEKAKKNINKRGNNYV